MYVNIMIIIITLWAEQLCESLQYLNVTVTLKAAVDFLGEAFDKLYRLGQK